MIRKILKWTGISLASLVIILSTVVAARQKLKFEAPYPVITSSTDTNIIARGKHIVLGPAHCIDCHSTADPETFIARGEEVPLSGGRRFELPVGTIYSRNITADKKTGIGGYTDGEIARILRYGVHKDGRAVLDFMPFHNMSDEDLTAVISYLRTLKPIENEVSENEPNILGNIVLAFLVKPVGPEGAVPKVVAKDTTAAYGKYLAVSVAECKGCHTPRNEAGAFTGEAFSGGNPFVEKDGVYYPPNLTPAPDGRITGWSEDVFIKRFRMGKLQHGTPMPWNSFKRMDDVELKAIYKFLRSLKPVVSNKEQKA